MRRHTERALAGALAALVLVSTLAAVPGAALALATSSPASIQADDLATVPDANIQANIPVDARDEISYNISEWRGSVMADQAADSMEVTLTTREAATGQATPGGPQFALQLTDDSVPDSRTVAVPADAIREAVGYTPVVVTGYHEDGSQWTASAYERGNLIVFDVPHFSTNTVTFGGTLSITGSPATDGSSYQYEVQDVDAVSDFQIGVTGSTAYDRENASAQLGNGGSLPLNIAGNAQPPGPDGASSPQLRLDGVEALHPKSNAYTGLTGSATDTVIVDGNQAPQNEAVTFEGAETTTTTSTSVTAATNGDTTDVSVGGNIAPEGPSSNNEPTVTFTGNTETTGQTISGTVPASGSDAFGVGGNLEPSGPSNGEPQLSVTPTSVPEATENVCTEWAAPPCDPYGVDIGGDDNNDQPLRSSLGFEAETDGQISEVTVLLTGGFQDDYDQDVQIRIASGKPDGTFNEGTKIGNWNPDLSNTESWVSVPVSGGPSLTAGNVYEIEFIGQASNNNQAFDPVTVGVDNRDGTRDFAYSSEDGLMQNTVPAMNVTTTEPLKSVSASSDGQSVSLGNIGKGETTTAALDLSTSASAIEFTASNAGTLDYSIDYTERTASEDPGLDWNNDGTVDASYSGFLKSGQTATLELSGLSTGSHTAAPSLTAGSVDWTMDWTELTALEDPTLSVDGETAATYTGTLRQGETATQSVTGLSLGSNDLTWSVARTGGGFGANLTWDETTHTEDPSIDIDGDGSYEISHVGTIAPGSSATYDASAVGLSTNSLNVATNNNSEVRVEAQYREVTQTENPAVEVNGHTTSDLGQLTDGETVQLDTDPSWINSGTNRINVSLGDGTLSADAPQSEVDLDYQHESVDNQTVQYTAQRWTERYNVSRTWLSDQSSASLTIPFKDTVLSIRDVEKRVGSNDWTELQSSDYALDGSQLTVQLGSINKNTEVGVRVDASRVRVNNGSIHVQEATEQGRKLDTQIAIDDWADDAYIQLPQREDNLIAYAYNESWSGPTDDLRVTADGERRLRLPNALAGGNARIATLPVEAAPQTGDVVLSVGQPSSTEPKFVVQPGQTPGDDVEYTFVGAADGTDYILYSQSNGIVRDSGTASSPLTLSDDDSDETLQFLVDEGEAGSPDDGSGSGLTLGNAPAVAVSQAQANPLGALLVAIIALTVLLGAYWAAKRRRRPRKGWIGEFASFVSTEVVLIGLSIIAIVAALRFNVLALPRQALFVGAIFGIELLGYLLLRYFGYFDWKIYGAASAIVAIASTQILVPEAFEALLGSNALTRTLPLVAAFGMYILYRAVEGWRRGQVTQIVVGGDEQN